MKLPIDLEPGEEFLYWTRCHWIAFWPRFSVLLVVAAFPVGFAAGFLSRLRIVDPIVWRVALVGMLFWVGIWLWQAARLRRRYAQTILTITSSRVITIRADGWRRVSTASVPLESVRDITALIDGSAATLFGFGDVVYGAERAGLRHSFSNVGRPRDVALIMREARRAIAI